MLDLIGRAIHHEALTPAERALLKLIEGFLITGLIAAVGAGADAISGNNPVVLTAVLGIVAGTFASAVLHALAKYWSAQSDPQLVAAGEVVEQVADAIDQKLQLSGSGEGAAAETTQVRAIGRTYQPKPPVTPQG